MGGYRPPGFSETHYITSNKSTSVGFFWAVAVATEAVRAQYVRPSFYLYNCSSLVLVRFAYQTSDDGITWSSSTTTPTLIGPAATGSEGYTYGSSFTDLTGVTTKYIRFGFWVLNSSGTALGTCMAAYRLEIKNA